MNRRGYDINRRFFEAIAVLKNKKAIGSMKAFACDYGINYASIKRARTEPGNHNIKTEWIAHLCHDYGVSCEWIILGKGDMMKNE